MHTNMGFHEDWVLWLRELKRGKDIAENWQRLAKVVAKRPRRRLYVRVLLTMAKISRDDEKSGEFAERAGDILITFLRKPRYAQMAYAFAARKQKNPQALLRVLEEINVLQAHAKADEMLALLKELMNALAQAPDEEQKQRLRTMAVNALTEGRPQPSMLMARIDIMVPWLSCDDNLLEEILSVLRNRERYDCIVYALEQCLERAVPSARRAMLFKLGHALRFGRGDMTAAANCFDDLIAMDENDREAWGELLECLDDDGDLERLALALKRRMEMTSGLEQRELARQLEHVFKKLGRSNEFTQVPAT